MRKRPQRERWFFVSDNPLIMEVQCEQCGEIVKLAKGASVMALVAHICRPESLRKPPAKIEPPVPQPKSRKESA